MKKPTELNDKRILIISGGSAQEEFLQSLLVKERYSSIIAVDRGLLVADMLKIQPNYIVGDFDSVPLDILSKYKTKDIQIETYPMKKDRTDTHIAIEMALTLNPSSIDLVGATGSRMDHTISNLELLMLALNQDVDARILDYYNCIYLKNKCFAIKKAKQHGNYVSLLPFSNQVKGLKLHGFKYPLDGITLSHASSLGISNELMAKEGIVEFEEGILAVFETKD